VVEAIGRREPEASFAAASPRCRLEEIAMSHVPAVSAAIAACLIALVTAPAARAADALEFPTLKNGQWEMTTQSSATGAAPRKTTVCLDANTQKRMFEMSQGMQKEMCTRMDMRRDGAKYVMDAECKLGESTVKSHGVMTMLSETAYRTESTATFDPPFNRDLRETKTVIDGKYLGACRDGMKPGDMITATGEKINLMELPAPRPAAPK
jgi:hypothetical protein